MQSGETVRMVPAPKPSDTMVQPIIPAFVFLALALGVSGGAAFAEEVTRQDADACEPDVHRLCDAVFPDEKLVAACLVEKRKDLSPACAEALARPRDPAGNGE